MSPKVVDQRFISTYMTNDEELANEASAREAADTALNIRVTALENSTPSVGTIDGGTPYSQYLPDNIDGGGP